MNWEKLHAITKNYKEAKFKKEKEKKEITEKNSNYIHIKKPKSYEMFFFCADFNHGNIFYYHDFVWSVLQNKVNV